jgi:hypothetical protein
MAACQAPSDWMAGIDSGRYVWQPLVGSKPDKIPVKDLPQRTAQDLRECEAPGGPATPAPDAVIIARAEDSPLVEACMAEKGYRKTYQQRDTMF